MADALLRRKLDRQGRQIEALERLIEDRSRMLYAAQAELQAANDFLAGVFGALRAAVLVVDDGGTIVRTNRAADQLLGGVAGELVGMAFARLLPPGSPGRIAAEIRDGELELCPLAGERVPVLFAAASLPAGADGRALTVCSLHDLRAQRQLESELRQAQRLESVGQLAAGIAHEINTPVQFAGDSIAFLVEAFDGMSRGLDSYRRLHAAVSRQIDIATAAQTATRVEAELDLDFLLEEVPAAIHRAGEGMARIATIVRAMKAFAHPGDTELAPAALNDAVRTTLEVCRNEYKYVADVALELDVLPLVECNLGDINQVVLNLVVNAAHAIESVVGSSGARGRITVRTRVDGDEAVIEVADTGGGIPPHVQQRMFEPFFTTKPVGKGSGQGLALVRAIVVDRHRGKVTFDTAPGRGTTFAIRLPIVQSRREAA